MPFSANDVETRAFKFYSEMNKENFFDFFSCFRPLYISG